MNFVINNTVLKLLKLIKLRLNPHLSFERPCSSNCSPIHIFSQLTVLHTVTIPQSKLYPLWIFFRFNYQLILNTLDQSCFENFSNHFTEQELLPFLIKAENTHPKYLHLLQINTDIFSQLEFLPDNTRAITAKRPLGHIMMKFVQINQWSLKKILLTNHNKILLLFFNLKHKQFLLFESQI